MYSDCFIERLDSKGSKTGYVNTKNGFYVCKNRNHIPVVYNLHATYGIEAHRFKTEDNYNGVFLVSCSENKNNGYFTIKCEKASY